MRNTAIDNADAAGENMASAILQKAEELPNDQRMAMLIGASDAILAKIKNIIYAKYELERSNDVNR